MNMKSDPFKNRQFFDYFFKEHRKAEDIQVMDEFLNVLKQIISEKVQDEDERKKIVEKLK